MSLKSIILATATLCSVSSAHIIMAQPIPYSVDKIDNSPITASQFPCKSQLGFTVSKMNTMAVGEQQTIKFKGTAVHGGGSCQLSVTTDTEPTANSTFKVIKSIEGGCPGVDGSTNEYQFEIPDSIPNGKATFAWTWFSKMSGAPELYMNCAPIEVTGGASDTSKFDALPDMFKANIGEGCTTAQNFATKFPNPGAVVQMGNTNDQKAPSGSCGASGPAPSPSGGAGYPASSVAGGQPSAAPSAAPSSAGGNNGQYTPPAGAGTSSAAATSAATSAAAYPTGPAGGASSAASATSEAAVTSPATSAAAAPTSPAGEASGAVTSAATSAAAYPTGGAGGVFAPGASSAAPVASTQTTLVTVTGTPSVPSATVPLGTAPLGTGSSGAVPTSAPAAGGNTCPTDGAILCNGPTQFGICDHGNVVYQPVAAGTTCSNGSIQKRGYHARLTRVRRNRSLFSHAHRN